MNMIISQPWTTDVYIRTNIPDFIKDTIVPLSLSFRSLLLNESKSRRHLIQSIGSNTSLSQLRSKPVGPVEQQLENFSQFV